MAEYIDRANLIARIAAGGGKADSWIDLAGYAACGAECEGVTE